MAIGRFAPSPSGELHLGNLRTALLAWLFARATGDAVFLRVEDLDESSRPEFVESQLRDLQTLGLDWDGAVVVQSERRPLYDSAISKLIDAELTYPCWCSRKDIRDAPRAPHGPPGAYPGVCRNLSTAERNSRLATSRPPALRLDARHQMIVMIDELRGKVMGTVDDMVIRRFDGMPSYHVAVVVDDAAMGVQLVVRGDDLLDSMPRHGLMADLLEVPRPRYAHVPLVLGPGDERLAKRGAAVTLPDRLALGESVEQVCGWMASSAGLIDEAVPLQPSDLIADFEPARIRLTPSVIDPEQPISSWFRSC